MGTKALIHVKNGQGDTLTTIYNHWDGDSLGEKIKAILNGTKSNGIECAAATLIAGLKKEWGGVYIYPPDSIDVGEEYTYTLRLYEGQFMLSVAGYNGSLADYKS